MGGYTMAQGTSLTRPQSSPLTKLPMRPAPRPMGTSGATVTENLLTELILRQILKPAARFDFHLQDGSFRCYFKFL